MANIRPPEKDDDYENGFFDPAEQNKPTTAATQTPVPSNDTGSGALLADLSFMETLLVIVCGICLLVLALSVAYFYLLRKLGRFSDNPWYKRRMYYAMSSSTTQNPARCFNVFKRERPNTLSLSGAITTPPTIIVPIPMMDAAVGDDKIYEGGGKKSKTTKGGKVKHSAESTTKHRISATSNAVGPMALAAPSSAARRSSSSKQKAKTSTSKYGVVNPAGDDASSDDSAVYVTPPQDAGGMAPFRKEKNAPSAGRAHKK